MKYRFKLQLLQAAVPYVQILMTLLLLWGMFRNIDATQQTHMDVLRTQTDIDALKESVECFYFVNMIDYYEGTAMHYVTNFATKNFERAVDQYYGEIATLSTSCTTCSSFSSDSVHIILYEDCKDQKVVTIADTILYPNASR